MPTDGSLLLGNEWINFDQQYYKIMVDEDGFYIDTTSIVEYELEDMPSTLR